MSEVSETTQYRYWLERLKRMRGPATPAADDDAEKTGICVGYVSAKSAKTDDADPGADPKNTWRLEAFRARLPANGPIWPPRLRDSADCDTPGHCTLCGDTLTSDPAPRFPRCPPCVRALTLALHVTREGLMTVGARVSA